MIFLSIVGSLLLLAAAFICGIFVGRNNAGLINKIQADTKAEIILFHNKLDAVKTDVKTIVDAVKKV